MANKKRLFLVDGMSNIFRAYYAIRGLTNSKGMATNAVYGFTAMLRKSIAERKPDYLGVVLDSKEPTIRQEQFAAYKAHRPPMPEDLVAQLPYIDRVCAALRVPVLRIPRYEADDIIGTLARKATEAGLQTFIVTNDKDLAQLVHDPDVVMIRVDKTGETVLDEAGVVAKYGVRADQIYDWLGLMGDAVDGIPGAPGIGEKGAVGLLEQFGTIEAALDGWEQVKKKTYRESLRDNREQILQSKQLATIDLDVPVDLDLDALVLEEPDPRLAHELFLELEFAHLTREFAEGAAAGGAAPAAASGESASYRRVATLAELRKVIDSILAQDRFGFALTESKGALTGAAFATGPGRADYFDLSECDDREGAIGALKGLFENGLCSSVVHDWKRALHLLGRLGISNAFVADDTLLAAYLLNSERSKYELPQIALEHAGLAVTVDEANAAAQAADLTLRLGGVLAEKIVKEELEYVYRKIDLPLTPILYEIERAGFRVDLGILADLSIEMEKELERLTLEIYELAGREFNVASPAQLGEIFEELNFAVSQRTATGKISTSRDVLEELAEKYELPKLIIEHRELSKLKGTYVDTLPQLIDPADGRIHTTLNQTIAATGRLSSTDPNLQNIPVRTEMGRRIRRAFIPAEGSVLLSADYSQIELRLLAHVTRDPVMLDAFRKGEDIHIRTAREVFGAKTDAELKNARRQAKIVNFGIAYVIGPFGLAKRVGISRHEAKKVIDNYYRTYAGVKTYMDELPERAREAGNTARSIFGRLRRLPDLSGKGAARAGAEREAVNMPMQGSASDIVKLAMLDVAEALRREKLRARMILQVHDELVFDVPKEEVEKTRAIVKKAMEAAAKIDVPLEVEIGVGANWVDAKP
ncbi:MAG: DNA polymerase I [Blastocatellia bacterium]